MVAGHAYGGNNLKKVKLVSSGREILYPLSNRDVAFVSLFKGKNALEYRNNLRMPAFGFIQYFEGLIERSRVQCRFHFYDSTHRLARDHNHLILPEQRSIIDSIPNNNIKLAPTILDKAGAYLKFSGETFTQKSSQQFFAKATHSASMSNEKIHSIALG